MNKSLAIEVIAALITIFLVVLLFNPFSLWMPMPTHLFLVGFLLLCILSLSIFLIKQDEREHAIRLFAYQASFLVGIVVLTIAVIWQSLSHKVDPWIVLGLVLMLLVKVISLFVYNHIR